MAFSYCASLDSRPIKIRPGTYCRGDSAHALQITQNMGNRTTNVKVLAMADDTPQLSVVDKELIKTALSELLHDIPAFRAFATNPKKAGESSGTSQDPRSG